MPVVLATLCAAAYANTFHVPFLFDDFFTILDNPSIRQVWPPFDVNAATFPTLWGRPLIGLSLKINYAMGGYNVVGYHLFNLLIHILNAMLAFGILRRTLVNLPHLNADSDQAIGLAFTVAALWMLHPLATECVTYVTQRTQLLMGFFLLSTLYCFIRGAESPHRTIWFGLAVIACILGVGAKEEMVVAPLLALAYDRVFDLPPLRARVRNHAVVYMGLAASWIVLLALQITTNLQWKSGVDVSPIGCWDYLAMQCGVITHYLRLAFWPKGLLLDYSDWPQTIPWISLWPRALFLLALLGASIWAIRQRRWWGFWGAWFFLLLAPSSSFLPLPTEPAAERRMYLPLLAVIAMTLGMACRFYHSFRERFRWFRANAGVWPQTTTVLVFGLALGVATFERNAQYRSEVSIWADVVAKHPENSRAQANLGMALLSDNNAAAAIPHFVEALRLDPEEPIIRSDLASALVANDQIEQGIAQYEETLQRSPNYEPSRKALTLIAQSYFHMALEQCLAAVAAHHDDPMAHADLAQLLAAMGRRDEAIAQYDQAIRLQPQNAATRYDLANLLAESGQDAQAILQYNAAAQLAPTDTRIQINLGNLYLKQAHWDKAVAAYTEALRANPSAFQAHNNIAIALANLGDLAGATAHFRDAARLNPRQPEIRRELAEVLDRQGLHDQAQSESAEAQRLSQSKQ
jgi:tetratricopeptide (TPR) repeat protein